MQWVLGLTLWNTYGLVILIILGLNKYGCNFNVLTPHYICNSTNCNKFGVILLTVLINLLCPILSICYWIHKLYKIWKR